MRNATGDRSKKAASLGVVLSMLGLSFAFVPQALSAPAVLTFGPSADTYVDSAYPAKSFGAATSLYADARSTKQTFLRFNVSGIEGRTVTGVSLRLYQKDSSPTGGRVFRISSTSWNETTTWNSRPAINGAQLGTFGPVQKNLWYELNLGTFISEDGWANLAIDSTSRDGSKWGASEGAYDPQLIVSVDTGTPSPSTSPSEQDGLTTVVSGETGSSDPTYYASNKRLAITENRRLLVVHGKHATGVQLAWKDPGGYWDNRSSGAVTNGLLLGGTGTGDWPASIVVERDASGVQYAWVVWGGAGENEIRPIQMRRLSNLDASGGPSVGPLVTIAPADRVNDRPDLAFERTANGSMRGVVTWVRKNSDTSYDLMVTWFDQLATDTPSFSVPSVITPSDNSNVTPTLVSTPTGMNLVARSGGNLRSFVHASGDPQTSWSGGSAGIAASYKARPGAVVMDNGSILAVVEAKTTDHIVRVQRFSAAGVPGTVEFEATGYAQPSIATDGPRAWIVMIRVSDGYVVSRTFNGSSWSSSDRVEIGPEGGGGHKYPNVLRRTDGRLRFVVKGPAASSYRSAALAYQRSL